VDELDPPDRKTRFRSAFALGPNGFAVGRFGSGPGNEEPIDRRVRPVFQAKKCCAALEYDDELSRVAVPRSPFLNVVRTVGLRAFDD